MYSTGRKLNKTMISIALVLSMTLCGCGKNAETVTDYGKSATMLIVATVSQLFTLECYLNYSLSTMEGQWSN